METLDNIIESIDDLKRPFGNDNNQSIPTEPLSPRDQIDLPSQPPLTQQKWRQTKFLSTSPTDSLNCNNSYSPDLINSANDNNENNNLMNSSGSSGITSSTEIPTNTIQFNKSGINNSSDSIRNKKNKNLSNHRLRKNSTTLSKEKRGNILREILSTEQAYLSFLKIIVDVYISKIKEKDIIPPNDIDGIFSNIEAIKSANEEILAKLKEKIENHNSPSFPEQVEISDIFLEFGPFLKIYSIYVNNYYNKAIQIIKLNTNTNKKFKNYLIECKNNSFSKKLDLNDLMIMPIQRLPRYILLLEELIQYTPQKTEENEHKKLIEAKNIMKDVASFVNSSTVDKQGPLEILTRVQQILGPKTGNLIQAHRRFIKSGDLVRIVFQNNTNDNSSIAGTAVSPANETLVTKNNEVYEKRTINLYLFNDILIYAVNNKFWRKLYLVDIWIRTKDIPGLENVFEIYSKSLSFIFVNQFSSSSSSTFEEWSTLIQNTINRLLEADPEAKEKRVQLLEQDDQIQRDFTFEEKQFFFESLNQTKEKSTNFKDSLIEDGIVEDRKKKIESLIIFQHPSDSNNSDYSDSEFQQSTSPPQQAPAAGGITRSSSNLNFSDSDSDMDRKKINEEKRILKKRMQTQSNQFNRTSSSVSLFTQQLTGKSTSSLSHIVLTKQNIVVQGYLTKIGEVVKNWKRRWFVFENNYLFYLKGQSSSKVLGIIPLIGSRIENIEDTSFNITTKQRTYLIIADSKSDLQMWTKAINEFYNTRDSFINNVKQQYNSNSPLSSSPKISSPSIQKRLSWLSGSLQNLNSLKPQNDKSKTIASFRFSSIIKENGELNNSGNSLVSPDLNSSVGSNGSGSGGKVDDHYEDDDCSSLSSEESISSEEEFDD
ncbi:hypothetical protein DICPUDRAFT_148367 [Dictyostelium purpureum]|uniref:Pleckstrin domain-containing protein n=1 Tax=Dictyostelium purpureum TaxID=5786 RepID=F0ZAY1_DICPU|nr:uncharacterized protein DICPUDRAFT_148367 [Dictyostelium purpureum]EGC38908.1 hypothetical protein DICPUDRAFT_148367 [Dictyostelium purpureum]|eukprot:XP_003284588.1 hypothetical protein DICPUDRAFT_148367 [Dictyostelium purpureum]